MNFKLLSWNVRGLNELEKRLQICNLLRSWRADIVCLHDTKLEWITRGINRSIWSFPYIDWLYLGSEGASRGIFFLCGIVGLWKKWRMQWDIFSLLQI